MSIEQLERMCQYSIEDISQNSLVDICDVKVDTSLPGDLRMRQYVEQIQNPYCFLCEGIPVRLFFANEERELSKVLTEYFCKLKG